MGSNLRRRGIRSQADVADLRGAACARKEHDHQRDIWTLDYHEERAAERLKEQKREAMRVCRTECPVIAACFMFALDDRSSTGIWGGTDEVMRERARALRRARGLR